MNLFDSTICNNRWRKDNMDEMAQINYVLDETPNVEICVTPNLKGEKREQKKTWNQKYRATKQKCDELCELLSELPEAEFNSKFEMLSELLDSVKNSANATMSNMEEAQIET